MICSYCGQENPDSNEFCDFCGGPLQIEAAEPAKEPLFQETTAPELPSMESEAPVESTPSMERIPPAPVVKTGGIYGNKTWWIIGCIVIFVLLGGCVAAGWGIYRFVFESGLFNSISFLPQSGASSNPGDGSGNEKLLFFDDFSNSSSGWDRVVDSDYTTDYYNGGYRITVNTDMYDSWSNPEGNSYQDAILEVEATKNSGPDDNDYGMICRYQDMKHFYYAIISSDGYYGIIKVTNDSSEVLGRDYLEYSDYISQGSTTNHLRFECLGDTLNFYANGQLLDQQIDGDYSEGNVGLIAGTYDTPGTDIIFDNFSIFSP